MYVLNSLYAHSAVDYCFKKKELKIVKIVPNFSKDEFSADLRGHSITMAARRGG